MPVTDLQQQCELGQQQLMHTDYLRAEATLAAVESQAWTSRDFDTLSRVYMPLQEARRQRRQRCGEGEVRLDLVAESAAAAIDPDKLLAAHPHGQFLVAGWGTIEPARRVRELAAEKGLYVETFLAAIFPAGDGRIVAIVPTEDVALPAAGDLPVDDLIRKLPPHSIILAERELPHGSRRGNTQTYAHVMSLWERLHTPYLTAADIQIDPIQKIEAYRKTIRVDYACELAHQKAANTARELMRQRK